MNRLKFFVCSVLACLVIASGCAPREATSAATSEDPGRDYSQVLRNVRKRNAAAMNTDRVNASIASFEMEMGRQPSDLSELVRYGFIDEIPDAPEGRVYQYNSVSRTLDAVAVSDPVGDL